jgi:hypothetical protein
MLNLSRCYQVDLILGIAKPTGTLTLIWHRIKRGKSLTTTTSIAILYLAINVIMRLSVALVGLTYSLNELPGVEYPVRMVDWGTDPQFHMSVADGITRAQASGFLSTSSTWIFFLCSWRSSLLTVGARQDERVGYGRTCAGPCGLQRGKSFDIYVGPRGFPRPKPNGGGKQCYILLPLERVRWP